MRRRELLTLFGAAAAAWPMATSGQSLMPVVGFLSAAGEPSSNMLNTFFEGLNETGYVEGRNVHVEYRVTKQYNDLPALASELVHRNPNVIFAYGSSNSARAAKAATTTIPIVFVNGSDPVALGLVASMARPGGNVTGVSFLSNVLFAKRLELLKEVVPHAKTIAVIVNPTNARIEADKAALEAAAGKFEGRVMVLTATTKAQIEAAFATAAQQRIDAILVNGDAFLTQESALLVALATRYAIPTSYSNRVAPIAGGLMSYGDNRQQSIREAAVYVGRILRGESPASLPVLQPAKFELVINMKTARVLGLEIHPQLLATADEVIE